MRTNQTVFFTDKQGQVWAVFAYSRLSIDPAGKKETHEIQRAAIESVCDRWGLPVVPAANSYKDTDKSASDSRVVRPGYERMMTAIRELPPKVRPVVVAYKQDRLLRQPSETQTFGQVVGIERDGRLLTALEGEIGLNRGGRQLFLLNGALGMIESDNTSGRIRSAIAMHAAQGRPHGGERYGWDRYWVHEGPGRPKGKDKVNEAEAAVVLEAAERFTNKGHSLRAICRDFNERGIPAPGAGKPRKRDDDNPSIVLATCSAEWNPQKLRQILKRKANIGIREYIPRRRKGGTEVIESKGDWPAILKVELYERMMARLNNPDRRTVTDNRTQHLLSGIATCGECGQTLRIAPVHTAHRYRMIDGKRTKVGTKRDTYRAYRCPNAHVVRAQRPTEGKVEIAVTTILRRPDIRAALLAPKDDGADEAAEAERTLLARKDEAARMFATGEIDPSEWRIIKAQISDELRKVQRTTAPDVDAPIWQGMLTADDTEAEWEGYTIDTKRSIVKALFLITVKRTERRGKLAFDPDSVEVTLKGIEGMEEAA